MSRIYAAPGSSRRTRISVSIVIGFVILVAAVLGTRVLGLWERIPFIGSVADPNAVTVTYMDNTGTAIISGTVNSPLKVDVRVPWSTGSQDTVLSTVTLQMLDDTGQPAVFGTDAITTGLAMKPTFDISVWEWQGSVPSKPGNYHARAVIEALYNKARNSTVDLPDPAFQARAESGPALTSGFVFAFNSNLWLLSTDMTGQRRLTFFPEFYEYADQPVWSPDGTRIAFTYSPRTDPSQLPATDIWQVSPDGTGPKALVMHADGESLLDPAWSSDGKYLYFTVDTSASVVYTDTTGAPPPSLGTTVRVDRLDLASGKRTQWMPAAQFAVSDAPGGSVVYLQYFAPPAGQEGLIAAPERLMRANADGSSPTVLADETNFQQMYAPRMSPDGKWVAFAAINVPPAPPVDTPTPGGVLDLFGWLGLRSETAAAHGLPWDMYLMPTSGGHAPIRLTNLNEDQPVAAWLDSSTVAFMGTQGLFKISTDGSGTPIGEPLKLHDGAPHGGLSWRSP